MEWKMKHVGAKHKISLFLYLTPCNLIHMFGRKLLPAPPYFVHTPTHHRIRMKATSTFADIIA